MQCEASTIRPQPDQWGDRRHIALGLCGPPKDNTPGEAGDSTGKKMRAGTYRYIPLFVMV